MGEPVEFRRPVLVRHARLRWDAVRGEHQIVFPEGVLVLNESAAAIVERCDGRLLSELITSIERDASPDRSEQDVKTFLGRLAAKGLLREAPDA
jgi:pyrroloquinoline quinone biosynthesis protein D